MIKFKTFLDEGINDPSIFKAIFLAGGPGSGKSFVSGNTALQSLGLRLINSDTAFEKALAKANLAATPESIFSDKGQEIRAKAKALTDKQMEIALDGRLGLVIDGTGKDYNRIKTQVEYLKTLGYDVKMIFVNTDLETALERNRSRDRVLPDNTVSQMWKEVQNNIGKFQNLFGDNFIVVDNSSENRPNTARILTSAYKKISAWSKGKPSNIIAKKWIAQQKKARGIKEDAELSAQHSREDERLKDRQRREKENLERRQAAEKERIAREKQLRKIQTQREQ